MKSLFNPIDAQDILNRLEKISIDSQRQWGKMDLAQMLAHCSGGLDMAMGKLNPHRTFVGRVIGPFFRSIYSNEKPFSHSDPTSDELRIEDVRDFDREKIQLIGKLNEFVKGGEAGVTKHPHPFFGPLTPSEWGAGMYKHLDHHLRQFGA